MRAPSYPVVLRVAGRRCLVVGGGTVAAQKAKGLVASGADVVMVAPWFAPESLALDGVRRIERRYRDEDLDDVWLVTTAVDDEAVTAEIAAEAGNRRIWCNAADRPAHCSVTLPAVHRDGDIIVAVSTDGRSPGLSSWLRNRIAANLGDLPSRVLTEAVATRSRLRALRSSEGLSWHDLFDRIADHDASGASRHEAERFLADAVAAPDAPEQASTAARRPRVHLVGAGPGDRDLMTLRAAAVLAEADVVLHDALVGTGVLDLVAPDAELIDVGKRPGRAVPQELISSLLVELAHQGRRVVRLKGGDPFVLGRGGEEALALQDAGVDYEVVPGVSSAIAAPAAAGVPVTHRGVAAAVTIVTGHRAEGVPSVDWRALAGVGGTIVVLMGVAQRALIAGELMTGGLAPDTPVAVVERATQDGESSRRCRLDELATLEAHPPATIVIGPVAAFDLRSSAAVSAIEALGPDAIGSDARGPGRS
ncbi:MAG: uroporphyrinogen-III C-methyltransferase [Actinomycetota bacterium]|nr:uroporphyrinogen-III C-methyltransferase [Actinomycetota bacterium]